MRRRQVLLYDVPLAVEKTVERYYKVSYLTEGGDEERTVGTVCMYSM